MKQILLTLLFDALVLPSWLMPKSLRKVKLATREYRQYLQEKVEAEREHLQKGGDERANLSATLVSANEKAKSEKSHSREINRGCLSENELYGNFFILNLAGHETTATSISFAVALLAAHQDVQVWIRAEVDKMFDAAKPYNENYPRLPRVMTVMYETLRLYGAVQNLNKYSRDGHTGQPLTVGGKTYLIPPSSYVSVNFAALHTSPQFWGQDSMAWRPQRWIDSQGFDGHKAESNSNTFGEKLCGPPAGAVFVAWALGPRDCPGKKFSKVEFVAVLAYLLKNFEIKAAVHRGENEEMAAQLYDVVHDCKMRLSPQFRRPNDAGVYLVGRTWE
jgi:cytochrome P450